MNSEVSVDSIDGRSQRRLDNGERLLDAAIDLLKHTSYQELSVDDICAKAEVGRATFFRAFKSKSGLIAQYNERLAVKVQHRLDVIEPPDAIQAIRIVGSVIADEWASASNGLIEMAVDHMKVENRRIRSATSLHLQLKEIVRQGEEEGTLKAGLPSTVT